MADQLGAEVRGMAPDGGSPVAAGEGDQPYQALYRRYRPQRFSEVRGQDHVTRALRNAVRDGRVAHAYLFSGPRGTGKTSTARILAMALNCQAPVDGEPDGTCQSCRAVRAGASMDVFELDAASNRKLEEMRDLLSRVALGTPGRWKVYIIDEVHQLTSDAASALLKTLEEPPGHVVFVLATTDPQKVLPTVRSRSQHFEFHLLDGQVLSDLLAGINSDAGLGLPDEALRLAVERGRGSARDAESALEQLAATGGELEEASPLPRLVAAMGRRDVTAVLETVATAVATGREPRRLGSELISYLRDSFLCLQAPSLVPLPEVDRNAQAEQAGALGLPFLVRSMELIGQALVEMREAVDPRVTLEVALIRLTAPAVGSSPADLVARLEALESAIAQGRPGAGPVPGPGAPAPGRVPDGPPPRAGSTTGGAGATPAEPGPGPSAQGGAGATTGAAPRAGQEGGPAEARAALGAILRGSPRRPGEGAAPGTPDRQGPTSPPSPRAPERPASAGTGEPPAAAGRPAASRAEADMPTRDQLTKAWGDKVLGSLPRRAQVYMASGRFTGVSAGQAVFALPDAGLVSRAQEHVGEAEAALAAHFGRAVPLKLVLDQGTGAPGPVGDAEPAPTDVAYDIEDLEELTDAGGTAVPPEQRILDAFPGAVVEG